MKIFVLLGLLTQVLGHKWPMWGQNVANTREQGDEGLLATVTIGNVRVDWTFVTSGDVLTVVTERGGTVYFTDTAGNLYAVDEDRGTLDWQVTGVGADFGQPNASSHTAPLITDNFVIIGTAGRITGGRLGGDATLAAFWKTNGTLAWSTVLDDSGVGRIDSSPIEEGGFVFVGTSSFEPQIADNNPDYRCCSFEGQYFKIDVGTGEIVWTYDLTSGGGTGAGVAGRSTSLHPGLGLVFVQTQEGHGNRPAPGGSSLHAININTGRDEWIVEVDERVTQPVVIANVPGENPEDPDIVTLFAGSNEGTLFAWNGVDGSVLWTTDVGERGANLGSYWGSASDGTTRFFVAVSRGFNDDGGGKWLSVAADSGDILWETSVSFFTNGRSGAEAEIWGPVTYANDIVYCPVMDADGTLLALDADSGRELNRWATGGTLVSGPSISGGRIFIGSGFSEGHFPQFFPHRREFTESRRVHSLQWKSS